MADKSLTYTIKIDASSAKTQARNVRAAFESELRQIKVGQLDTSGLKSATGQAKALTAEMDRAAKAGDLGQLDTSGLQRASSEAGRLRQELEQAGKAATNIKPPSIDGGSGGQGGLSSFGGGILGGLVGGAAISQLKELGQALEQTARRGAVYAQLGDVLKSYTKSVGSSSAAFLDAGKKASQGTIAQYDLILNANRAIQFEVAKTSEQYGKLIELSTALGRAQGVSDTQSLDYIVTGLARESKMILDNLSLNIDVTEVTAQYAETLGKTTEELTAAERKTALLNEAFRQGQVAIEANRAAAESAATQIERFDASVQDLKDSWGELIAAMAAGKVKEAANAVTDIRETMLEGGLTPDSIRRKIEETQAEIAKFESAKPFTIFGFDTSQFKESIGTLPQLRDELRVWQEQLEEATNAQNEFNSARQNADLLRYQTSDMQGAIARQQAEAQKKADIEARVAAEKMAADQETAITKALAARAEKSVEALGADRALELYQKAKEKAETAIKALVTAGVTDAAEFGLRTEQILQELTVVFDNAEASVNQVDFSAFSTAFSSLDQGFVDFLPTVRGTREELAELSAELVFSGSVTQEQADRLDYLNAIAYSVSDSTSQLSAVTAELGYEFLNSNEYAAALVDQLYLAEGAYRAGLISADVYAGITAVLTGQLATLTGQLNMATSATYALNSAQSDMASPQGLAIGGSIAGRIQVDQGAKAREHNRRELDRYAKDQARALERSGKAAGKSLEDGAKKASQDLKAALQGVEGLFNTSKVTQEDMDAAKAGTYKTKADEYVRRFEDEVVNGVDWANVSLEEVRAGLERAGLDAGATAEQTLANLKAAYDDSSLFSAAENIPIFIDTKAVEYAMTLQDKAAEGEKNIFEYFGVKVDDAVDAATGGGGGGAAPVRPPDLVDVDPLREGIQTGVNDMLEQQQTAISTAFAKSAETAPGIYSFTAGGKTVETGTVPTTIPITVSAEAKAYAPYLKPIGPEKPAATATATTIAPVLTPTIDATALQTELDKITASVAVTLTLSESAASTFALGLGNQLSTQAATFTSHGSNIGLLILGGIGSVMGVGAKGETTIDIAGYVGNNLSGQAETFTNQGRGVASLLKSGITDGFTTVEGETNAITPLITDLNTQIRTQQPIIANQGITIAQMLIAGMVAHFKGGQQSAAGAASGESVSPFADALMTNLSTQFTTTQNMFHATGFLPAAYVESGFKAYGYDGLSTSFLDKLTLEIRSNAESFGQRGGTMAGYVQSGFVASFSGEGFKSAIIAAGELMASYLQIGILSGINGGQIADAIAAKVAEDIATEIEK